MADEQKFAEREQRRKQTAANRSRWRAKRREKDRAARAQAPAPAAPPTREHGPGRPKTRQGVVVSAKPDKTITVRIDFARRHRQYKKIVRASTTLTRSPSPASLRASWACSVRERRMTFS